MVLQGGPTALPGAADIVSKVDCLLEIYLGQNSDVTNSCPPIHQPKQSALLSHQVSENLSPNAIWFLFTTVASKKYAPEALRVAGVPIPALGIIASDDVSQGKPHPAPYLAGAFRCGVDPKKCMSCPLCTNPI